MSFHQRPVSDYRPRSFQRRPHKPKPWSHQDDLAQAVGKNVGLAFVDGEQCVGRLLAADAFTVKLEFVNDGETQSMIVFKHVIAVLRLV